MSTANAGLLDVGDETSSQSSSVLASGSQIILSGAGTDTRDMVGQGAHTDPDIYTEGNAASSPSAEQSIYRKPGVLAGGMIDTGDNGSDFTAASQSDTINSRTQHRRVVFSCTTPLGGNVTVGLAFNLYCTATIQIGDNQITGVQDTNVITDYSGPAAWADIRARDIKTSDTVGAGAAIDTLVWNTSSAKADSTDLFTNGKATMSLRFTAGADASSAKIFIHDAFCTGVVTVVLSNSSDTVNFIVAASGGTHETNVASMVLSGRTSVAAGDSVRIYFDNVAADSNILATNGIWSCSNIVLKDNGGQKVAVYAFASGIFKAADTITLLFDRTRPKITGIADTSTLSGNTYGAANRDVIFYIVDTGSGFSANSGCTLTYQQIGGSTINDTAQMTMNNTAGTWTASASIPFSLVTVDTQWRFWVVCTDDVGNTVSSALTPPYTVNNAGTVTIAQIGVRSVVISEVMWDGGDSEYVELYNPSNSDISLASWTLKVTEGGSGWTYTFGDGDTAPAKGYFLLLQATDASGKVGVNDLIEYGESGVDTAQYGSFSSGGLRDAGDSIVLKNASGIEIDSAPFNDAWPAGGSPLSDNKSVSMERKITGTSFDVIGYGGDGSAWDSNLMKGGFHGRAHGSPGRMNSVSLPYISELTPLNPVLENGRGKWTITVTNGPIAFANGGKVILQAPPGWSAPGSDVTVAGYTTVSVSNGSISSTSFSGQSVIITFSSWAASSGALTITYGDYLSSDDRRSAARAQLNSSADTAQFFLFAHSAGGVGLPAGDTGYLNMGRKHSDTVLVVDLGGGKMDTTPSVNPQSFLGAEYDLTFTFSDSMNRKIYGAHDSVSIRPVITTTNAADSHIHEMSTFSGVYDYGVNDTREVGGWTNASGEFTVTVHVSSIAGNNAQLNQFRVTDADKRYFGTSLTHSDSVRLPVPVINEVAWDGIGAAHEYVEIYNPTHQVQVLTGHRLISVSNLTDSPATGNASEEVGAGSGFNTVFSLDPFHYLVIVDATNVTQDIGGATTDSYLVDAVTLNESAETLVLQHSSGGQLDVMGIDGNLEYYYSTSGAPDAGARYALERVFPNRTGQQSSSWASSDSIVYYNGQSGSGAGSPGRPNSKSLYPSVVDRFDSQTGRTLSAGTLMDTARVALILKIASGDTQPNQQIGARANIDAGPVNYSTISDSSFFANVPTVTDANGTALIRVSANSNNVSGTVTLRVTQPYGVTDSAYIVFDRGDSLGYVFQTSETDIIDTSATNELVVFVGFSDTFSGLDSSIMPQIRWKIGSTGTYSSFANMAYFDKDTFTGRIDIGSNTYAIKPHDYIYWQVVWRDKAGNWDTSANNDSRASEFITNTVPFDTIVYPTFADTVSGSNAQIQLKIGDYANDYCTITVKYDTSGTGQWATATLVSGSDTVTNLRTTTSGVTHNLRWNAFADLGETTIPSVRLLIQSYDGWDTRTDTGTRFGYQPARPDTPIILIPTLMGMMANTTVIQVRWRYKTSLALDTQTAWEVTVDTGPNPDWLQLADSHSRAGTVNETYTIALAGGHRYHVRVRTWDDSGMSPYSEDTWFWVPRRVMDGFDNDWNDTTFKGDTNAGYVSGGEFIWLDRIGDMRTDAADPDADFDLTEMRVISDSYYYFFLFRFSGMSATNRALISIGIDSDRKLTDTWLTFLGDDAGTLFQQQGPQFPEFDIDYALLTADSPIWIYRDTSAGSAWERMQDDRHEYFKNTTQIAELGIFKTELRPIMTSYDTIRITVGIANNANNNPASGDRTTGFAASDHLDIIYPGSSLGTWGDDLSDGKINFYLDIFFKDTGDVRPNGQPSRVTSAITPTNGSETSVQNFTFRWAPATDPDPGDTVTYWLRLSADSTFASSTVDTRLIWGGETYALNSYLLNNKTYYWQVRSRDNHGAYSDWGDTFTFTARAAPDTPYITAPVVFAAYGGAFENTTTIRVAWNNHPVFLLDTQGAWEMQVDYGPGPDWVNLADSQSAVGTTGETRTVELQGGYRYHVRVRTRNDVGYSPYSEDTWFWAPRRVMDGNDNDWVGAPGLETDAASISNGEWIWMDRIGDERGDATDPDIDFDLTEMRVFSDSYYFFFLFRFQGMSATTRPLISIGIDSDRKLTDTGLSFLGDDATTVYGSGGRQKAEFVIDYGVFSGGADSPIWAYRDTTAGVSWERLFDDRHEYAKASSKIMELGIAKMDLRPTMSAADTYLRLTVGIAENNDISPNAGDRTKGAWTPAHLDAVNPGFGPSAWSMELNDNDIDFFFDISFTDTGDVRRNNPPTVAGMTAVNPPHGSDTSKQPNTFRWTPASDTDPLDTVTYWFRIDNNADFSSPESQVLFIMDSEQVQVAALADSGVYYWQVRARDNHGFYSNWSDTFSFRYAATFGTIDGDTSDWIGIASTTVHDTVISNGEWIYTGDNDDQRTDLGDIDEADINQVRFSGNQDSLLIMVRFKNVATTDNVHIAFNVDLDQNAADGALTWLAPDDQTAVLGRAALYGETNVSIHNPSTGATRIEMFDQGGSSWHAGSAQTLCYISTVHDVLEAAIPWKDFSVKLPRRIQFTMASYYNNVDWNNNGNITQQMSSSPDANDVVTPLPTAAGSSWGRDLADNDYDSGFVINFNKTGRVNHYSDTPNPQVADSALFGETQAATMTLAWLLTDFDSRDAKDSNIRVTIRNDWTGSNVFDSNGYGFDTSRAFIMPQRPGWYTWQVRHADDFSTSALSTRRHFKINTPPRIYITSPVEGDTLGFLKGIQYYVTDSTTVRDTVSKAEYSPDSGANWYPLYQQSGNTQNIAADADGETYTLTWGVSRNLFDSSIASARVQIRLTVTDGADTHVDTVYDLNLNTLIDTGSVTVFVSDRGDSTAPFVGDTDGAISDIQRAINLLTPSNGPDTVVIFQRLSVDSWRLTVAVNVDSGMTLMGFREWNRIVNGQNTDTGGAVDTYAKIANSANTSVIYIANVDNVKIIGLILEGDSTAGAAKNGVYLDNSSNDSVSLIHIYRMNTAIRLSASETNRIAANVAGRNLNEGIRLVSSSQNNTIRGNQIATNDSAGISAAGGSDNNIIQENTVRKGAGGLLIGSSGNIVAANSVLEQRTFGVQVDGGLHNRIVHNRITNSATYGMVMINGAQGNLAAQNEIDSSLMAGVLFAAAGTNHTDTFEANNITRGDTGALNAEGATFDIRYNWWGTSSEDGVGDTVVNTGGSTLTFQPFSVFQVDTTAGADTISPNSMTMKTDSTVTATSATIKWDTVTTDRDGTALNGFEGFYVFRWTAATPLWFDTALIDTVLLGGGADTQYVDTPDQLTTYYYRVAAFDSHYTNGQFFINVSALSDTLVVSTPSANTAPRDTIILPTTGDTFASGETYSAAIGIKFVILDPDSNFCTVVVHFSKDSGQTWAAATLSGTSVIANLYAPTFGDTKTIAWLSKSDVPDTLTGIARIRITPGDGTDTGLPDTTLNFGVDNQRPPIVPQCTTAAVVGVADSGVYVFWAHAPLDSDVRGYYVYRNSKEDSVSSTRLSGLLTDTTGYKDMSVIQGDTRYYYVTSVDTYDNEGDSSRMEAAPNLEIAKTISDSSNPIGVRPGDTMTYRVTIRNNGFAPADSIILYDYVPSNTIFYDSATALSITSSWTIHYRVLGANSMESWQSTFTETATMVRFSRANRMGPSTATPFDTLTIRVKIQ